MQWRFAVGLVVAVTILPATFAQQHPPAAAASPQQQLLKQYCVGCHNQKLSTAGVALDRLDTSKVGPDSETWEKILRKVSTGQMPPAGLPRPKTPVSQEFSQWLESQLDQAAIANPNPGRPVIHRLNRAEYSNAVRDLLALDIKPGSRLPADDSGYGFDNIGEVLSLSPVLIERYMSVARMVSRLAVGDSAMKPEVNEFDMGRPERPKLNPLRAGNRAQVSEDLPFDSMGGMLLDYHFPVDGEYVIKVKLAVNAGFDGVIPLPKIMETRIPVKAGTRKLGVTFLAENAVPEVIATAAGAGAPAAAAGKAGTGKAAAASQPKAQLDVRLDGARVDRFEVDQRQIKSVSISGPYNVKGPGDTPSRKKLFVCEAATTKDEDPCARKILSTVGHRAYRRPFTETDLKPLLSFYQEGRKAGGFDNGIEMALRAILVSPEFLFRIERDPAGSKPGSILQISDLELASRLSFFLWSSIPDDELLSVAEKGTLRTPDVLSAQVDRMLQDRKSNAFVRNFAGQWLYLRNLAQVNPDPDAFPEFDSSLRKSFERETELFFAAIMRENRPVTDLLSADFTYLNQRLAEHYGIPGVYGPQFRRVTLTNADRGGLLGQGSILTVTSYPNRTSVVQRGKWVLENLLGSPPPPPPPDIPTLEAHSKDGKSLTMRQQMEQHRANPTCASCHSRMDPIGFSLENYDGVGAWRAKDSGNAIDATGKLPDGTTFSGPTGLKNLLLTGHRDEFIETFTEKLFTYALGRGLESSDMPAIRDIIKDASSEKESIPGLIHSIVKSPQFQMRRTRES
jgi:Protein of unknown function (DUF1592)/Protein of unknown function (DUF1588)/Protein of unknown function (DUF1587)/Protein of unknown function (DUF1595)/Protein of unknown function (DUF1585)/Planctomycete cytochrome C